MIAVIIAGGSGTRLWPLSTPDYPKHLLKLTGEKSLIQNTLSRVRKLTTDNKTFVITEDSHDHHVQEQLGDFPGENILIEPARRGTASCVLLTMRQLKQNKVDPDEPIAFLWADHLIRDERGFVNTFKRAGKLAKKYQRVVFIGAEPAYPSTGFGYMEHGKEVEDEPEAYGLLKFHEKPDAATAKKYYASGRYFWNMGYLVSTLGTFEAALQSSAPDYWKAYQTMVTTTDLNKTYLALKTEAIDYAFSEKVKDALVIPGGFDWADIGSFGDLHNITVQDTAGNYAQGNHIELEGVTNSYVYNHDGVPVAVIGLDNVVVVHSPHGILVTNKNFAQKIGEVSKRFNKE